MRRMENESMYPQGNLPNSNVNIYEEPLPEIIDKRWKVQEMIGTGSFSDVYAVKHICRGIHAAMKVEPIGIGFEALQREYEVYKAIESKGDVSGFAKVFYFGRQEKFKFLIISSLGNTLQRYWYNNSRSFSANTVLLIGEQLVCRISQLHAAGYYHGDISLSNIMTGRSTCHELYLIDFGVSEKLPSSFVGGAIPKKRFTMPRG